MKNCKYCSYDNDDIALFCIKCGKELPRDMGENYKEKLNLEEDLPAYMRTGNRGRIENAMNVDSQESRLDSQRIEGHSKWHQEETRYNQEFIPNNIDSKSVELKPCPFCGEYNTSDIRSCCNCGALLQLRTKPLVKPEDIKNRHRLRDRSIKRESQTLREEDQTKEDTLKEQRTIEQRTTEHSAKEHSAKEHRVTEHRVKEQRTTEQGTNDVEREPLVKMLKSLIIQRKRAVILSFALLILVIVGILVVPKIFNRDNDLFFYGEDAMDYVIKEEALVFITNQKQVAKLEEAYGDVMFSLDRTKAVVLTSVTNTESGGDLYYLNATGKLRLIDYGVIGVAFADSGNGMVYYKDYDRNTRTATLYLYQGKESIVIGEEVGIVLDDIYLAISPDGNTVAYYEQDDLGGMGYISAKGEKGIEFGENKNIIAIADNSEYIYYMKYDKDEISRPNNLYVKHKKTDTKLYGTEDYISEVYFNKDYSEIMLTQSDVTHLSLRGKEKERLALKPLSLVLPRLSQYSTGKEYMVFGISHFENMIYQSAEYLYYLDDNYKLERLAKDMVQAKVTKDMRTLIYQDQKGDLYSIKKIASNNPETMKYDVGGNTQDFVVTDSTKKVYFVTEDGDLYLLKKGGEHKRISSEVAPYLQLSGDTLYFLYDYVDQGMICHVENEERVTVAGGDEVKYMFPLGDGIIYSQGEYNDSAIYGISQKDKIALLVEDVVSY